MSSRHPVLATHRETPHLLLSRLHQRSYHHHLPAHEGLISHSHKHHSLGQPASNQLQDLFIFDQFRILQDASALPVLHRFNLLGGEEGQEGRYQVHSFLVDGKVQRVRIGTVVGF